MLTMILFACSTDENRAENNDVKLEPLTQTFKLKSKNINGKNTELDVSVTADFNPVTDQITNISLDQNTLNELELTNTEFNDYLNQYTTPGTVTMANGEPLSNLPPENLSGCLVWCQQNYTTPDGEKMPGRGACKFACYMGAIERLATKLIQKID